MLESLTQEYRVSKAPPALASAQDLQRRRISATSAPQVSTHAIAEAMNGETGWLARRMSHSLDRFIDEMFRAYDRIVATPKSVDDP